MMGSNWTWLSHCKGGGVGVQSGIIPAAQVSYAGGLQQYCFYKGSTTASEQEVHSFTVKVPLTAQATWAMVGLDAYCHHRPPGPSMAL